MLFCSMGFGEFSVAVVGVIICLFNCLRDLLRWVLFHTNMTQPFQFFGVMTFVMPFQCVAVCQLNPTMLKFAHLRTRCSRCQTIQIDFSFPQSTSFIIAV